MKAFRKQSGVVLLTVILVILAATSFTLLRALNSSVRAAGHDRAATHAVLAEAKLALIGYALSFPERSSDADAGPGRLPCPDIDFTNTPGDPVLGSADSCALASGTETGLFPWYTIDTNEMRDASGARLWYAVSDAFRSNAGGIVNSDTADVAFPMRVDDSNDEIVAVIIAPGPALGQQTRGYSRAQIYDPAQYLEGENASTGDNLFSAVGNGEFNDTVLAITRNELMAAVQQRVLREVLVELNKYHHNPDDNAATTGDEAYPWLRPFGDPNTISAPTPGNEAATLRSQGQLAIHQAGQEFDANFSFTWSVATSEGTLSQVEGADPPNNFPWYECVYWNRCFDAAYSPRIGPGSVTGVAAANWQQGHCRWTALENVTCTAVESFQVGSDTIARTYTITINGIDPSLLSPTASADRERAFRLSSESLTIGSTIVISLRDVLNPGIDDRSQGTTTLTLSAGDVLTRFELTRIPLYLTTYDHTNPSAPRLPGALPNWFIANDWHRLLQVAFADAERPGDPQSGCVAGGDCLRLTWTRSGALSSLDLDDLPGVLVMAGSDISANRPSTSIGDYFEAQNASVDNTYAKAPASAAFNDQILRLDPYE